MGKGYTKGKLNVSQRFIFLSVGETFHEKLLGGIQMKKALATVLISTMVLGLTACGGTGDETQTEGNVSEGVATTENGTVAEGASGENVTITYCNFNASGGNEETLNAMYEKFHEQYPNITVEIETVAYDDYFTMMQTRVAGGTAPDCYELNIENFASYASKGVLADLSGADTSNFNDTALSAFNVSGTQYGLPGNFSNVVLIYNKDLFDQAQVEYPTSDWTWEDAQVAAEAISNLGDDIYGIYAPLTYNEFYKVAAQYGGGMLNEDKTEFTINSPENIEAAQMMIDRVLVSNVQPNEEQMGGMGDWDLFESGRLGMIPTGIWAFNTFTDACDFEWDICVEPGATDKATHFFSNALVVNADSEEKEAATTWITWLASSDEAAQMRIDAGWDLPAIKNETVLNSYLEVTPPENKQAVFDSLDYLVVPPIIEDYSMMSDIISEKLSEAASGKMTVEEALNEAQEVCESSITLK